MTMKKLVYTALLFSMLTGCYSENSREVQSTQQKRIKVTTQKVRLENNEACLTFSGTVEPSQTIPLLFKTSGTVEKVLVEEGDVVKKGQLLATVDKTDALNLLEIAQSKYQQAIDAYDRLKHVYEKGSLPEIKWVEMETNLSQAKSSLELAKNNLEKCKLISPANGIIGNRNIEPGMSSVYLAGAPLEIVDIKTVNIKISVPENEVSQIKKGLKAEILVAAPGNKQYRGEITKISPVADRFSRTYDAKIEVNNPGFELKPGMVCDVNLHLQPDNKIVLVPYSSVTQDENGDAFVFLVDSVNKKAVQQGVKTGNYVGSNIEILAGLTEGQEVVCEGNYKLTDNSLITW